MPSTRDIAFIGCRLLALYFLYAAIQGIPHGLYALSTAFGEGQLPSMNFSYQAALWLSFASPILSMAMVLVLWFGASWLSREMADGAPEATPAWSPRSLLSVGVVLSGLVLVSFALPQIALYLLFIADGAMEAETFRVHYLVAQVVQALVGTGLILGAERIAGTIARLRHWSAERPQA